MHHPLAIALSFVLLLPVLGRYACFYLTEARLEAVFFEQSDGGYPADELVFLAFSRRDAMQLEWEHDTEFVFQGQWYDVVERTERTDSLLLWCRPDSAETRLYDWWQGSGPADPDRHKKQMRWQRFLQSLVPPAVPNRPARGLQAGKTVRPALHLLFPSSVSLPPPVPPPDAARRT